MRSNEDKLILERLDAVIGMMQILVALDLKREGVPQTEIAKRLRVAKATVGTMLKGTKKNGRQSE